ncbi:serine hydrolase domain-containing protein [Steroidobacter cummioxidans]|uniref:serine hydrolase domain-containing protein n=1 Tax=Steroidobacter cummioxidans TaxID=1803913 RepID=UPI000E319CDB|nr:serine hydrolase domain-containing protein [Steroidobacter cummioxidans]
MNRLVIFALLISAVGTHAESAAQPESQRGHVPPPPASLDRALANLIAENGVLTAGVGVIDDGNLVWTGYYGEPEPGVPASAKTRFNVASITKTVAAETALRLVAKGKLDLDEPLAPYWIDPDIAHDPRREQLTARMVLNHTSGFPNWRFSAPTESWPSRTARAPISGARHRRLRAVPDLRHERGGL